jgi:WD40 repeat protein
MQTAPYGRGGTRGAAMSLLAVALLAFARPAAGIAQDRNEELPPGAIAKVGGEEPEHGGTVSSIAVAPDGKTFATAGGEDGAVRLWATATGRRTYSRENARSSSVSAVGFAPDGKMLAVGERSGKLELLEAATGNLTVRLAGHSRDLWALEFSKDGKSLASVGAEGVFLWDVETGRRLFQVGNRAGRAVRISPDGRYFASGADDGTVVLWDAKTGGETRSMSFRPGPISSVAFSPDGKRLAAASAQNGSIRIWEIEGEKETSLRHGTARAVQALAFSPDGTVLVSGGSDGALRLWETAAWKLKGELDHHSELRSLAFSPDGNVLISGGLLGTVRLWDVKAQKELLERKGHLFGVSSLTFSRDGERIASGGQDGMVMVWDARSRKRLLGFRAHPDGVFAARFDPSGRRIATGGREDTVVRLWEASTGKLVSELDGAPGRYWTLDFTPDGKTLAGYRQDEGVRLWDLEGGRTRLKIESVGLALAISPDGRKVATSLTLRDDNRTPAVQLWDVQTGKALLTLPGSYATAMAFSPDGTVLAVGARELHLWDVATGKLLRSRKLAGQIGVLTFSPDGNVLAVAGMFVFVSLWDSGLERELAKLSGLKRPAQALAFSPDGKVMVSGGAGDSAILFWDTSGYVRR